MRTLNSRSLVLDVYGAFVRDLGGWISVSDLIELLAALGSDEQVTRTSVSRFTRKGLLERRKFRGVVGYELTAHALHILAEGDDRIYDRLDPGRLADGWALLSFSIPERIRAQRHQLRSRLTWLGFGSLGGGAWIAPRRMLEKARRVVAELELEPYVDVFEAHYHGFASDVELVRRCWDLGRIRESYQRYIDETAPVLKQYEDVDPDAAPRAAFADYVASLHEWRKLPFMDPGLPQELLPDDWQGRQAADIFGRFQQQLEPAARRYVVDVVST
jgi:phenylacetic acid degradation operon negative regulatory protein